LGEEKKKGSSNREKVRAERKEQRGVISTRERERERERERDRSAAIYFATAILEGSP